MRNFTRITLAIFFAAWHFAASAADATVSVADFQYTPQAVTINVGDKVTWNWVSGDHPTQSDSNPAAFPTFPMNSSSTTFSHTFTAAGVYPYHCQAHGVSMSGVVNVVAAPTGLKDSRNQEPALYLYPNPAQGLVKISLDVNSSAVYKIRITNVLGETIQTVSDNEIKLRTGEAISLQMHKFPAGFYFFSLFMNDKIMDTRRLVLEK